MNNNHNNPNSNRDTMQDETFEQLAEKSININFGNRLTPEEHALAVQIAKEIYYDAENLSFDVRQAQVAQSDQDLQTRLNQADTAEEKVTLRNPQESFAYLQRGLEHAEAFVEQGETSAGVREPVLSLYDGITDVWTESEQIGQVIQHLPLLGLWSWTRLGQAEQKQFILRNWHNNLSISPASADFADFTAAFQALLHTFLLVWHDPQRAHRHFVSTDTLLAISESLYGLEHARENQRLSTVYRCLQDLQNSPIVQSATKVLAQQHTLAQQLHYHWQQLSLQPAAVDDLATLQKLSGWQKVRHWWTIRQLRHQIAAYQQLPPQSAIAKNDECWQRAVKQTEQALLDWLLVGIDKKLNISNALEELPMVIIGIILAHSAKEKGLLVCLETWQHTPPWQDADLLQAALTGSGWQTWLNAKEPTLQRWLDLLPKNPAVKRLNVAMSRTSFEQPELQTWLREFGAGKPEKLFAHLKSAWEIAQQQASRLAIVLGALAQPDFQGNMFARSLFNFDKCYWMFQQALAAVILGDAPLLIKQAVQTWLKAQDKSWTPGKSWTPENLTVFDTLDILKYRVSRAVSVYHPSAPPLADTVHDWAKVRLTEVLQLAKENYQGFQHLGGSKMLWQLLEQARFGLSGLSLTLPDNWEETLGKELWEALIASISLIEKGHETEGELWPLLTLWLKYFETLLPKLPSVETCQQHLRPFEVLVQPFLDPIQQRFRVLWLDKNGLVLKD